MHVTLEEGTWAAWLYDLLRPHVTEVLVCDPRQNAFLKVGNKSDRIDARKLAELLYLNMLKPVYHGEHGVRALKELSRSYLAISGDLARVMTRLKAVYRSWAIPCAGKQVYAPRYRAQWLGKISEAGVRRRAEFYYQQLDALRSLRQQVRRELLAESGKHQASKLLCQIPSIGPIRAAQLIAILQTPHRFRTKRQLWAYGGLAIETHSSADHRYVDGQLQPSKRPVSLRGLNRNHNHDLKNIFKGAAIIAATKPGPFPGILRRSGGQRNEAGDGASDAGTQNCGDHVDRLEERSLVRRPTSETTNSLSVSGIRSIPGIFPGGGQSVLETLGFESESPLIS